MVSLTTPDVSIIIVSFNTREALRECLQTLEREVGTVSFETIVFDNGSTDGSVEMVASEYPKVRLLRSRVNFGFASANNWGFRLARGRYIVLLNPDAFVCPDALRRAVEHMDAEPRIGMGGARLISRDGSYQSSARSFPSPVSDILNSAGLATKLSQLRLFAHPDRTGTDPNAPAEVDWVPGTFAIIRRDVLDQVGYFDEDFFLYYEQVDLCRRIKAADYSIWYWPDVAVAHPGSESSDMINRLTLSSAGAQLTLWCMRSALLYYRKYYGWTGAWLAKEIKSLRHHVRAWQSTRKANPEKRAIGEESRTIIALIQQAWRETQGGLVSPPQPW